MAVYAHPDDADVAAGGVLAQWARDGCEVRLVVVCDGAKGSHVPLRDARSLRNARRQELQRAADLLGATSVTCLDQPDGGVVNSEALRETLVGLVRKYRPEVVLGPDPTATFFGGVYVNHRDIARRVGPSWTPSPRRRRCPCTFPSVANHIRSDNCS